MPERAEALELDTRRRIYQHLQENPGAHMRQIGRELEIPMGTLEYHLHFLTKARLLTTREDARYTRYFVAGEVTRREKDVLALLRQAVPRQIATHLLLRPDSSHKEILQHFDISGSTLSFHLKKLLKSGLVEKQKDGRQNRYRVTEPALVAKVLISYRKTFLDDVVDRFAKTWLNMEPRRVQVGVPEERRPGHEEHPPQHPGRIIPPPAEDEDEEEERRDFPLERLLLLV